MRALILALLLISGSGSDYRPDKSEVGFWHILPVSEKIAGDTLGIAADYSSKIEHKWSVVYFLVGRGAVDNTNHDRDKKGGFHVRGSLPPLVNIRFIDVRGYSQFNVFAGENISTDQSSWRCADLINLASFIKNRPWICLNVREDIYGRRRSCVIQSKVKGQAPSIGVVSQIVGNIPVHGNPWTPRSLHFMQLTLHDVKLSPENTAGNDPDCHKSSSVNPNPPSPSRRYQITIGFFFLTATVVAVFVPLKSAEYADEYWPVIWWLPLLGGLVLAYWLAGHALNFLVG